jgi:hypothetical protein
VAEIVAMAAPTAGPDAGSASDRHRSAGA